MADRFGEFLRLLDDPAHYTKVADVPVFDAHEEVYYVDAKGRLCSRTAAGARRRVKRFDKKTLEVIAARSNARDRTGTLTPLTRGHTIPDEAADESKQPVILGYARNYRVRFDPRLKKDVIAADYFLRKECEKEARSYPRTSVELWPGDDVIDPIALLRRTPARDLGQWTYGREGTGNPAMSLSAWRFSRGGRAVLRYSLETKPMAEPWEDDADQTPAGAPFGEPEMSDEDKGHAVEFMKHCMSHPHAMKFAKMYAAGAGAEPEPPVDGDGDMDGDPTMTPDATEPMRQHKGKGPGRYARGDGGGKALEEALKREAEAEARNWVQQLGVIEGFHLDPEQETLRFARCYRKEGDEGCQRYAAHIRTHYKEKIDAPAGRTRVAAAAAPVAARGKRPETIDDLDEAQTARVVQYRKQHGGTFADAFAKVFGGK